VLPDAVIEVDIRQTRVLEVERSVQSLALVRAEMRPGLTHLVATLANAIAALPAFTLFVRSLMFRVALLRLPAGTPILIGLVLSLARSLMFFLTFVLLGGAFLLLVALLTGTSILIRLVRALCGPLPLF
jgi:hypothetical protein